MLLTRNEIHDSQVQLVSRFIGGLRPQLQTSMAQFDPTTIGEAHRRASSFEQQSRSRDWNQSSTRSRPQEPSGSKTPSTTTKETGDASSSTTQPETQDEQQLRRSTRPNALRFYLCGEPGHLQISCLHATRRGLIVDDSFADQKCMILKMTMTKTRTWFITPKATRVMCFSSDSLA